MPSFYLAGASADVDANAERIRLLVARGFVCTYDWTRDVIAHRDAGIADRDIDHAGRARLARADLNGVAACDWFWLVIPPLGRSVGAWIEFGHALAWGKRIVVSGDYQRCIFTALEAVMTYRSHDLAFEWLAKQVRDA